MNRTRWLVGGALAAVAVLAPPAEAVAEELFTAHMTQHLVVVLVAAPLLALGTPRVAGVGGVAVTIVHAGAIWMWHLPTAYDAALDSNLLHALEHLSFLGTGWLFWIFVLRRTDVSPLQRVGATFATALQSSALGALLTFASRPLYSSHLTETARWGLTPLQDQQLAGAVMWIPPGIVYLVVMLVLLYRWFGTIDASVTEPDPVGGPR